MNYFIKKNLYSSYKHSFNFEIHDNKYKLSLNIHCMIESYLHGILKTISSCRKTYAINLRKSNVHFPLT